MCSMLLTMRREHRIIDTLYPVGYRLSVIGSTERCEDHVTELAGDVSP